MRTKRTVAQVGCDCHREFSKITARDESGEVIWRQRLDHSTREKVRLQLHGIPAGTPFILEGTFGWGWLCDELQAAGLDPHLANSAKVAAWREARGIAKSDRVDADLLSELWTQQPRWWEVWLAPPSVREQREWFRHRSSLVQTQTAFKNRVHAVLHRHGIIHEFSDLFGKAGRRYLSLLVAGENKTLPESGRMAIQGYLQVLDQLRRQIATLSRTFRQQVRQSPTAMRLRTLPGICWILSYTINAEIGDIHRFRNAKRLCSYSLLAPRANETGDPKTDAPPKGRRVGHMGRRTLKWAWIEAAHGAVHKGGHFREIFNRYTDNGKRDRNRGYIVVAHELCRIAYSMLKRERNYDASAKPTRPGSQKTRKSVRKTAVKKSKSSTSRPGTGQPQDPMVAAVN